ncbi:ABC transporter substrate-binding protein [Gordonia sp. ABSL11-1]|uniref:ABC transporter substrate-binding protein n=1 Tax=Gordonia sp. ABSL11-1 TaxID=3053924 RepID=UPI002573E705|nr:ABC transporter substrate-binding protein [Gordonia sp. ABSL11-1]MDL9948123.1 ABC transporter substrate-binding protein [Gordonia sp. ABSL11-1]
MAINDSVRSLDPHIATPNFSEALVNQNVYDKLLWQDPKTGDLKPWLATKWETNNDATSFRFWLRPGVTFSDGSELDAQVVKDNLDQLAKGNEELGLAPVPAFATNYGGTTVLAPDELEVTYTQPAASFLNATSFYPGAILGEATLKKSVRDRQVPANLVGSGPFTVKSYAVQGDTVLARRTNYNWAPADVGHSGAAYLDSVTLRQVSDEGVRVGAVRSQQVDVSLGISPTSEKILDAGGLQVIGKPLLGWDIGFYFQVNNAPTNDPSVRKAIVLGWDRDGARKLVTSNYSLSTSVVSKGVPGWVDHSNDLTYDPSAAAKLLDDDGWKPGGDGIRVKDGKRLTVKAIGITNFVVNQPLYEYIQSDLRKIGIQLDLQVLPIADYGAAQTSAKRDGTLNASIAGQGRDDISVIRQTLSPTYSNLLGLKPGDQYYQPLVDVTAKLDSTTDPARRAQYAADAQKYIIDNALVNPVYTTQSVQAANKNVQGITFDSLGRNFLYTTWLSN